MSKSEGNAARTADPAAGLPYVVVDRSRAPKPPSRWARAKRVLYRVRFLPLVPVLVVTGGIVGMYFQPPGLRIFFNVFGLKPGAGTSSPIAVPVERPAAPDPALALTRSVVGLGKLVPAGDVFVVAPPFGAGDARIARVLVAEGERVEKGKLLATLDNEATLQAAVESARATLAAREAAVEQATATVRANRAEADAVLQRAEAVARNARLEFERVDALFQKGLSPEATYQQRRSQRDESARDVEKARANFARWDSPTPQAHPDVVFALRNRDSARVELARATGDLDKARITAPIDGTVLTVHVRPGERPAAKGILNLGNLEQMTVEIEVYQTLIGAVSVGDAVEVTAEALARALKATVTRIGLEVGRQVLTDANPAANTDARVVKVTAELDAESSQIARRYTNLQVMARIAARPQP